MSSEGTAGGHEGVQKTPENTWNDETIRYQTAREIRREVMERIIDLGEIDGSYQQHIWMQELRTLFVRAESMIFFVGAGMSVQCGIPAFRGEDGLYMRRTNTNSSEDMDFRAVFDYSIFSKPHGMADFNHMVRSLHRLCEGASPSAFHGVIDKVAGHGRLQRVYTQNIDELEAKGDNLQTAAPLQKDASGRWPNVIQLHGSVKHASCTQCRATESLRIEDYTGDTFPEHEGCSLTKEKMHTKGTRTHAAGVLRPRITLYHDPDAFDGDDIWSVVAADSRSVADVLVVVGTTLAVDGAKRIVTKLAEAVKANNGQLVWINSSKTTMPPPMKGDVWDFVVRGTCDDLAGRMGFGM